MTSPTLFLFSNNAQATLASAITDVATSVTLAAGTGALFPSPAAGQQFGLTFTDADTGLLTEIVYCTSRTADVLTIVRAREGTVAQAWGAGDFAANFWTKAQAEAMAQPATLQSQPGNIGADAGGDDAYVVVLDPVVTTYTNGLTIRFTVTTGNTGAATLNAGGGAAALVTSEGDALTTGDILPGLVVATYLTGPAKWYLNTLSFSQFGPLAGLGIGPGLKIDTTTNPDELTVDIDGLDPDSPVPSDMVMLERSGVLFKAEVEEINNLVALNDAFFSNALFLGMMGG